MSSGLRNKRQARALRILLTEDRPQIEVLIQARRERRISDTPWCDRVRTWPVRQNLIPRSLAKKEVELDKAVCEGRKPTSRLLGLVTKEGDGYTRTRRPPRWSVTAGLNLKIDGVEVASGPVAGLCALGRYLHDLGYPEVGEQLRKAFGLHEPFEHDDAVALSDVTQAIVADLLAEGLTWETAGKYLGVGREQWHCVHTRTPTTPGRLGTKALRCISAGGHPRVVAWILGLTQSHGLAMASELLQHLQGLGLAANRNGDEWSASKAGRALIRAKGGPIDPLKVWVREHPGSEDFIESMERALRYTVESGGHAWFRRPEVRNSHIAHVVARAGQARVADGCELALALWSRAVAVEVAALEATTLARGDSEIKALASKMPTEFLRRFFAEKDIPPRIFEVSGGENNHTIPNTVVVEAIAGTQGEERRKIEETLRKLDFANGDINHFLEHLAEGLAHQFDWASPELRSPA